jgi:hypothetical protein
VGASYPSGTACDQGDLFLKQSHLKLSCLQLTM